jgi:transposase-like protein
MEPGNTLCPRCKSAETIRTATESRFDYWHCYNCGKTFDVAHTQEQPARRAMDNRRRANLSSK